MRSTPHARNSAPRMGPSARAPAARTHHRVHSSPSGASAPAGEAVAGKRCTRPPSWSTATSRSGGSRFASPSPTSVLSWRRSLLSCALNRTPRPPVSGWASRAPPVGVVEGEAGDVEDDRCMTVAHPRALLFDDDEARRVIGLVGDVDVCARRPPPRGEPVGERAMQADLGLAARPLGSTLASRARSSVCACRGRSPSRTLPWRKNASPGKRTPRSSSCRGAPGTPPDLVRAENALGECARRAVPSPPRGSGARSRRCRCRRRRSSSPPPACARSMTRR